MLTLSAPTGDIEFKVVDGIESTRQRIVQGLRFHRGEWFLNTRLGVPYLGDVFGYPLDTELARQVITAYILRHEDVTSVDVDEVRFVAETRTLFFKATVSTIYGDISLESQM